MSLDKKPQRPVIQRLDRGLIATTVFVSVPFLFVLCSASVGTFFYFLLLASSLHALEGTATGRLGPYPYGLLSERQWFPLNGKVMGKNSDWPDLTDIRTLGKNCPGRWGAMTGSAWVMAQICPGRRRTGMPWSIWIPGPHKRGEGSPQRKEILQLQKGKWRRWVPRNKSYQIALR